MRQIVIFESGCDETLTDRINTWLRRNFQYTKTINWHVTSSGHSQGSHGGAGVRERSICVAIEYEIDSAHIEPSLNGKGGVCGQKI